MAMTDPFADRCYIKAPGIGVLKFQFLPDDISDSKNANYNDIEIIGRSFPLKGYSSSGSRQLSFTLQFYAMDSSVTESPLKKATALRALCYPQYKGGIRPPPVCVVKIGKIRMRSILTSCSLTYKYPWAIMDDGLQPMFIEASLTFDEVGGIPWELADVFNYADMNME